jgi:hypothetical protein
VDVTEDVDVGISATTLVVGSAGVGGRVDGTEGAADAGGAVTACDAVVLAGEPSLHATAISTTKGRATRRFTA